MTNPNSHRKATASASAKPKRTKETQQQDDQPTETIEVQAVEVTELDVISDVTSEEFTSQEQRDRTRLEEKVETAFYEAGSALRELRDRRLYRSTHKTFEEYCKDRFGFERRHPYRLIEAADVVDNLKMCPIWTQNNVVSKTVNVESVAIPVLPTSEGQVRPLTKLEPVQQQKAWLKAVEAVEGKVPSGRVVKDIVDKIRERTKIPNPYREGEICVLQPKDNPDLRGKAGFWGVIIHVGDYSCTVQTWDGEYTVKIEQLKSLELLDDDCKSMQQLCMRLRRLHQVADHDPSVDWLLQGLGKQAKPYLSGLQARILGAMEREYKLEERKK